MTVKLTVTKGVTVGVGNYESVRVEATASFDVNGNAYDTESVRKEYAKAYAFLDEVLDNQIAELQPVLKRDSVFKNSAEKAPKRRMKNGS